MTAKFALKGIVIQFGLKLLMQAINSPNRPGISGYASCAFVRKYRFTQDWRDDASLHRPYRPLVH